MKKNAFEKTFKNQCRLEVEVMKETISGMQASAFEINSFS